MTLLRHLLQVPFDRPAERGANLNQHLIAATEAFAAAYDASNGPVLVHCWHGSDRTGCVCASHRIIFSGWSREQANAELRAATPDGAEAELRDAINMASADAQLEALRASGDALGGRTTLACQACQHRI